MPPVSYTHLDVYKRQIKSRVTATPWQKALKLCDIDYTPVPVAYTQGFQPAADGQRWWYQFADGNYAVSYTHL